jgi:hypothetical protein
VVGGRNPLQKTKETPLFMIKRKIEENDKTDFCLVLFLDRYFT